MTTNAPNLPDGLEYCDEDECFNIVPGGGLCADHETLECNGHPAGPSDPMGETIYCDGRCRTGAPPARLADYPSIRSGPIEGPTYTDLAREVDRLKEQVQELTGKLARSDEMLRLRNDSRAHAAQRAVIDLAHELAEMEPAARDAALRRIIDNAQ